MSHHVGLSRLFPSLAALALLWIFRPAIAVAQADPLPSWNGAVKTAITGFVAKVTAQGGPEFVAPELRIAAFDNDGTLWAEQPFYFQGLFTFDEIRRLGD